MLFFACVHWPFPTMETLSCRSPSACRACPHSDRSDACTLEAQIDAALEGVVLRPFVIVTSARARMLA